MRGEIALEKIQENVYTGRGQTASVNRTPTFLEGRQNNFDFIRVLLAVFVVCSHIVILSENAQLQKYLFFIPSGLRVCAFFIISGLLVSKSYNNTPKIKDYVKKRANRILPAYIFVVVVCAVSLVWVSEFNPKQYFISKDWIRYLGYNLAFLNFLQPDLPGVFTTNPTHAVNGSLWNIKIEVAFYVLLPVMIYWLNRSHRKFGKLIFLYIISLIYRYLLEWWGEKTGNNFWIILSYQFPGYLCYFICGMALFFYRDKIKKIPTGLFFIALVILRLESYFELTIFKPIALAVVVFYVASRFKFLNNFGKYGDFSYGIYIYHYPVVQLVIYYGWFDKGYSPLLVAIFILLTSIVLGILSWFLIEKRFLRRR